MKKIDIRPGIMGLFPTTYAQYSFETFIDGSDKMISVGRLQVRRGLLGSVSSTLTTNSNGHFSRTGWRKPLAGPEHLVHIFKSLATGDERRTHEQRHNGHTINHANSLVSTVARRTGIQPSAISVRDVRAT